MPRPPLYKSGPMTPAERQREKRARDKETVWSTKGSEADLSDGGLLEQLAIAFRKERNQRASRSRGAITRGLVDELLRRLGEKQPKP